MEVTDRRGFAALMARCSEYYGKEVTASVLGTYWNSLQRFDLEAVEGAIRAHMENPETGQFMPKIADIIKFIDGLGEDAALIAWTKVDKAVRHIGPYADVVFDDPIIHRVLMDMGGWMNFGNKDEKKEWPFVAKEFQTRYRGYRLKGVTEYPPLLTGITNAQNVQLGYERQDPLLIGDEIKARKVLTDGRMQPALSVNPVKRIGQDVVIPLPTKDGRAA